VKRSSKSTTGTSTRSRSASANFSVARALLAVLAAERERQPDDDCFCPCSCASRRELLESGVRGPRAPRRTVAARSRPLGSETATPVRAEPKSECHHLHPTAAIASRAALSASRAPRGSCRRPRRASACPRRRRRCACRARGRVATRRVLSARASRRGSRRGMRGRRRSRTTMAPSAFSCWRSRSERSRSGPPFSAFASTKEHVPFLADDLELLRRLGLRLLRLLADLGQLPRAACPASCTMPRAGTRNARPT